jgi:ABC-type uncharacterized transport system permease subunit
MNIFIGLINGAIAGAHADLAGGAGRLVHFLRRAFFNIAMEGMLLMAAFCAVWGIVHLRLVGGRRAAGDSRRAGAGADLYCLRRLSQHRRVL